MENCKNLSLSVSDNGVKVTYTAELEKVHEMDSRRYTFKEYVFSDKDIDKAFSFFKEKLAEQRSESTEEESEED